MLGSSAHAQVPSIPPTGPVAPSLVTLVDNLLGPGSVSVEPFRVVGNIYYLGAADLAVYLITTPQGHILVDSGSPAVGLRVASKIEKLGFKPRDVKVLLNTHAHIDHIGGHTDVKRATGAAVLVMDGDAEAAATGHDLSSLETPGWEPIAVDRVLHDNDEVTVGGQTMRAIAAPGHTAGNTTWVTTVREGDRTYQVVFGGFPTPVVNNPKYNTPPAAVETSFSRLRELKPDIVLLGHTSAAWKDKGAALRAGQRPHPLLTPHSDWIKRLEEAEANYRKNLEAARNPPAPKP
jgi:metallo-beta-lactamase class B